MPKRPFAIASVLALSLLLQPISALANEPLALAGRDRSFQIASNPADQLFREALALYQQGQWPEARQKWQQALQMYRQAKNEQGILESLNNIGLVSYSLGDFQAALKAFGETYALQKKKSETAGMAISLNQMGLAQEALGLYAEALNSYAASLELRKKLGDRPGVARSLKNIAQIHQIQQDYEKALALLKEAEKILLQQDKAGEMLPEVACQQLKTCQGLAAIWLQTGLLYQEQSQHQWALDILNEALALQQNLKDRQGQALTLKSLGDSERALGQLEAALKHYQEALELSRLLNDARGAANAYNDMGLVYYEQSQYAEAQKALMASLQLRRQLKDSHGIADSLNNLGETYRIQGEQALALKYFQEALNMQKNIKDRSGMANSLGNLGLLAYSQGEYPAALKYFEESLAIHQETKNEHGKALVLNHIGEVHRAQGDFKPALKFFQQALAIHRKLNQARDSAYSLNNIALIAYAQGNVGDALKLLKEALTIVQKLNDRKGQALSLNNLGMINSDLADYETALAQFEQSLGLKKELIDRKGTALALNNIGAVLFKTARYDEALTRFNEALALQQALNDRKGMALTLNNIGLAYYIKEDKPKAVKHLQEALSLQRKLSDREGIALSLRNLGLLYESQGQLDQARQHYQEAIETIEDIRSRLASPGEDSEEQKSRFLAKHFSAYERLIPLLVKQNKPEEALYFSERSKARSLLDMLSKRSVDIREGADPQLLQREKQLTADLVSAGLEQVQEKAKGQPDAAKVAELETQLEALRQQREEVIAQMRHKAPKYATLKYPEPLRLKAIQLSLAPGTALVEYFVSEDQVIFWLIKPNDFKVFSVAVPRTELRQQVEELRHPLVENLQDEENKAMLLGKAHSLYQRLLQPAASELKGLERLYIVPDDILTYLPFEMLVTEIPEAGKDNHYLVEDLPLSYIFSATTLDNIRHNWKKTTRGNGLIAFGNPNFAGHANPLPGTKKEVEKITRFFSPFETYMENKAKEETAKSVSSRARLLHFSTHGMANETNPLYSEILLSLEDNQKEDGLLQAHEIFNMELGAELVTLSACQTGLGKFNKGEGIVGFSQALFYAGTPSIVSSLWSVSDEGTVSLMEYFYAYLAHGQDKDKALQLAKIDMLQDPRYDHPVFWAPFILIGDYQKVDFSGMKVHAPQAKDLGPQDAEELMGRGLAYLEKALYPPAIADFTRVTELEPKLVNGYGARGRAYSGLKQYPQAIADYTKVLELEPGFLLAYVDRAKVYIEQKQYPQAIADYTSLIALEPEDTRFYKERARLYQETQQPAKAIADLTRVTELEQSPESYHFRGRAYYQGKRYAEAMADAQKAIGLYADFASAYDLRALLHLEQKRYAPALADALKATELLAEAPHYQTTVQICSAMLTARQHQLQAYTERAKAHSGLKLYPQALEDFTAAIRLEPQQPDLYTLRGDVHSELKQYQQTVDDYTQALALEGGATASNFNSRGWAHYLMNHFDQALADASRALELDPANHYAWDTRAQASLGQGQTDQALTDINKALELAPDDGYYYHTRSRIYLARAQLTEALADADKGLSLYETGEFYLNRGHIYQKMGNCAKAQADYRQACKLEEASACLLKCP